MRFSVQRLQFDFFCCCDCMLWFTPKVEHFTEFQLIYNMKCQFLNYEPCFLAQKLWLNSLSLLLKSYSWLQCFLPSQLHFTRKRGFGLLPKKVPILIHQIRKSFSSGSQRPSNGFWQTPSQLSFVFYSVISIKLLYHERLTDGSCSDGCPFDKFFTDYF